MNLYIIRHGIAEEQGANNNHDDSQRALTDTGRKKMYGVAEGLRAFDVELNLILSSPYLRTRETAEIVAEIFKMKNKLVYSENLTPAGELVRLIEEINEKHLVENLAVVGHEPSLSSLVSLLLSGQPSLNITMKKGGVCCLSMEKNLSQGGGAVLEWLLTPHQLIALGK
jgi:phosphohistidine phosphatase